MNISFYICVATFIFFSLVGCSNTEKNIPTDHQLQSLKFSVPHMQDKISYLTLGKSNYHKELLANGKLVSQQRANLKFRVEGIIREIAVREGAYVQKGQLIATLDDRLSKLAIQNIELAYQQAKLDYEDQLLRAGFKITDTVTMPKEIKHVARIRSGLEKVAIDLKIARINLQEIQLLAPFSGKVANLKAKAFNNSFGYDYICTLVDDNNMEVVFKILEQELPFLKQVHSIEVFPYHDKLENNKISADIKSINPLVDGEGMIEVRAILKHSAGSFMDGMNVKIRAVEVLENQLKVPKSAVLDRQNRKVVFTLVDSVAQWNYVEIGGENKDYYLIADGLNVGDKVIYKGNFNLAHDKLVTVESIGK